MGYARERRGIVSGLGYVTSTQIQTITSPSSAVSTGAALTDIARGTRYAVVTTAGSGAGYEIKLAGNGSTGPAGREIGTEITVGVETNSTAPVTLLLESTSMAFHGSTANAVVFSTNSSGASVSLLKLSTSEYMITGFNSLSTDARPSIAGSTGTV